MLAWLLGLAVAAPLPGDDVLLHELAAVPPAVESLRALHFREVVPTVLESPDDVRAHVLADLADPDAQRDLADVETLLRALHLVRGRLDLPGVVTEVLSERIGGYYDPDTGRLVVVRGSDDPDAVVGPPSPVVAAHELVHALQDQHFGLGILHDRTFTSRDAAAAVTSLIEGDATYAMLRYGLGRDVGLLDALSPETFHEAFVADGFEDPPQGALAALPALLRDELASPYVHGLAFARTIERLGGWAAVDRAYASPPLSTEHILHPERWLAGDDPPLQVDLPDLSRRFGPGTTLVVEETLGELGIRSLFASRGHGRIGDAEHAAADGWGGDRLHVYRGPTGLYQVVWRTVWDTDADATAFADGVVALSARPGRRLAPWGRQLRRRVGTWTVALDGKEVVVLVDVNALMAATVAQAARGHGVRPIRDLDAVSTVDASPAPVQDDPRPPTPSAPR